MRNRLRPLWENFIPHEHELSIGSSVGVVRKDWDKNYIWKVKINNKDFAKGNSESIRRAKTAVETVISDNDPKLPNQYKTKKGS